MRFKLESFTFSEMWNRLLIVALLFASFTTKAQNEVSIIHDGHYQGKNLYVQNPFAGSGVGFCVIKVTVNGDVTTDQFASSAFEIDFSNLNLEVGDPVTVKIFHKGDCLPKVLNPEVLRPRSTFETVDIKIENNILKWTTPVSKESFLTSLSNTDGLSGLRLVR